MKPKKVPPTNPAHTRVVLEFQSGLLAWARRFFRNPTKAEDCVQSTFAKYFARWPDEQPTSPGGFLFVSLKNECIGVWKNDQKMVFMADLPDQAAVEESTYREIMKRITPEELRQEILALSPPHSRLLWAKYIEGHSGNKIAKDFKLKDRQEAFNLLWDGRGFLKAALLKKYGGQ